MQENYDDLHNKIIGRIITYREEHNIKVVIKNYLPQYRGKSKYEFSNEEN